MKSRKPDWPRGLHFVPSDDAVRLAPELEGMADNPVCRALVALSPEMAPRRNGIPLRVLRGLRDVAVICAIARAFEMWPAGRYYSLLLPAIITGSGDSGLVMALQRFVTKFLPPLLPDLALSTFDKRDFASGVWGAGVAIREHPFSAARPDPVLLCMLALVPLLNFLPSALLPIAILTAYSFQIGTEKDRVWFALSSAGGQLRNLHLQLLSRKDPLRYFRTVAPGCLLAVVLIAVGGVLVILLFGWVFSVTPGWEDYLMSVHEEGLFPTFAASFRGSILIRTGSIAVAASGGWILGRMRGRAVRLNAAKNRKRLYEEAENYWQLFLKTQRGRE